MTRFVLLSASMALAVVLVCGVVLAGCGQASTPAEKQEKKEGVEQAQEQTTEQPEAAQPEPALEQKSEPPTTIPGLSAGEVVSVFEENGLECAPHVPQEGSALLYTCTSADNQDLELLYKGKIEGTRPQRVQGVEVRVSTTPAGGDLQLARQSILAGIASEIEYEGANGEEASDFVHHNQHIIGKTSTTIGGVDFTLIGSDKSKSLEIALAQ